jgi:hypothetical protein
MHPPFGFALFYLRGISDTLFKSKALPRNVLSSDIYWGALPWVVLQLVLVAIVIAFPQTVTAFLDKEKAIDLNKATEQLQQMGGGRGGETGPGIATPAPRAPAGKASTPVEGASNDDAMEAVRRALEQEQNKKP